MSEVLGQQFFAVRSQDLCNTKREQQSLSKVGVFRCIETDATSDLQDQDILAKNHPKNIYIYIYNENNFYSMPFDSLAHRDSRKNAFIIVITQQLSISSP